MGIISVSRLHGSGGTYFAKELAKRLEYSFVNRTFINKECRESDKHVSVFGIGGDATPGLYEKMQELMVNPDYHKVSLVACILARARENNVVFTGMGTGIVLAGMANTINIRMVRRMEERVGEIARVKDIGYDDAYDLVERMDEGKREFVMRYFGADVGDPSIYHAVINSSHLSLDDAIDITAGYSHKHLTPSHTEDAEGALTMLLLERRAELLLFHIGMAHCYGKLAFKAKEEGLMVTGTVRNEAEKDRLLKALRQNTEISRIYDEIESGVPATM
jgi:cytidylate kinase